MINYCVRNNAVEKSISHLQHHKCRYRSHWILFGHFRDLFRFNLVMTINYETKQQCCSTREGTFTNATEGKSFAASSTTVFICARGGCQSAQKYKMTGFPPACLSACNRPT